MKRYIISKYIKRTGHVIEGRGNTKVVAQKRFKAALVAFRNLKDNGLFEVDQTLSSGGAKVWTRKQLVSTILSRQNQ